MTEIISNKGKEKHIKHIVKLISESDEIIFAVAFLKQSGLDLIMKKLKKKGVENLKRATIKILVGGHLGLTEPKALNTLMNLQIKEGKGVLKLVNYSSIDPVFHDKVYYFKKGKKWKALIGSANLTKGGLMDNQECSVLLSGDIGDKLGNSILDLLHEIEKNAKELNEELLIKYSEEYSEKVKNIERAVIELMDIREYYHSNRDRIDKLIEERKKSYKEAKEKLDMIADETESQKIDFNALLGKLILGKDHLWWSSGLQRNSDRFPLQKDKIKELIQFVKKEDNIQNIDMMFKKIKAINGCGVNFLTELLITYYPDKFAILNGRSNNVLKKVGTGLQINSPSNCKAEEYANFVTELEGIKSKIDMSDFLALDTLFSEYYDDIKKNKK